MPVGTAMGGGILYNKKIYAELGLTVPKTWAEFVANNEKIKAAGKSRRSMQTFGDTWTSQLFVLADYYNVQRRRARPSPSDYTANKAKYATTPAALAGLPAPAGGLRRPGTSTRTSRPPSFDDGLKLLADGEGAHYPMLTFAVGDDRDERAREARRHRLLRPARATTPPRTA